MSKYVVVIIVVILILLFIQHTSSRQLEKKTLHTKCYVINLEKNKSRLGVFNHFFHNSDISMLPLERFNAIKGIDLSPEEHITKYAYNTLLKNEKNKFRTQHYQLTRGAIGCYLSHTSIFQKLLNDPKYEYYIIFEDDAVILPNVLDKLNLAVKYAPVDWDILLLAPCRKVLAKKHLKDNTRMFDKLNTFWGLRGYLINKKGAAKFLEEFNRRKISMQIDSKMSHMIIHGNLNVYVFNYKTVRSALMGTDIQMPLRRIHGINPFSIEDL